MLPSIMVGCNLTKINTINYCCHFVRIDADRILAPNIPYSSISGRPLKGVSPIKWDTGSDQANNGINSDLKCWRILNRLSRTLGSHKFMNRQKKLSRALKKQKREINHLKQEAFQICAEFGKLKILSFTYSCFKYPDGDSDTQKKINDGYYNSVEDFDSTHTADVEFIDLYEGKDIFQFRNRAKNNLIELGKCWRERVAGEHPDVDAKIIVHQNDGEWFLDTFNYPVEIEGGICL